MGHWPFLRDSLSCWWACFKTRRIRSTSFRFKGGGLGAMSPVTMLMKHCRWPMRIWIPRTLQGCFYNTNNMNIFSAMFVLFQCWWWSPGPCACYARQSRCHWAEPLAHEYILIVIKTNAATFKIPCPPCSPEVATVPGVECSPSLGFSSLCTAWFYVETWKQSISGALNSDQQLAFFSLNIMSWEPLCQDARLTHCSHN